MKKINMVCLPFAGGNKYSYRPYKQVLPSWFNLVAVEYPGRGSRMSEKLLSNMDDVVDDAFTQVKGVIDKSDYILYGHSMGAAVGFELLHRIYANNLRPPIHFFVTGTTGPSCEKRTERNWHNLSKADFIQKLKDLQGCPSEIFQNSDLLDFVEPIIRSDFKVMETYKYRKRNPLPFPITVITGDKEVMEEKDIKLWQDESVFKVDFRTLPGHHFFIFDFPDQIFQTITEKLNFPFKLNYL